MLNFKNTPLLNLNYSINSMTFLKNPIIEEKRDFQDLNSAEIAKINLLKIIISIELTMINQEEKRNLGLTSTVGEVEIEPFK